MLPVVVFFLLFEICGASDPEVYALLEKAKGISEGESARAGATLKESLTNKSHEAGEVKNFLENQANQHLLKDDLFLKNQKDKKMSCSSCGDRSDPSQKSSSSSFVFQEFTQKNQQPSFDSSGHKDQILVFVSFSMGESVLKELTKDATKRGARVIIRGLIDNSWQKTLEKLKTLQANVDIDPEAFKRFDVKVVPTFVLVREKGFSSLEGNVSFSYAQKTLYEERIS
jgi:type-F conjugative transfer system pilin assembly protein TrbC